MATDACRAINSPWLNGLQAAADRVAELGMQAARTTCSAPAGADWLSSALRIGKAKMQMGYWSPINGFPTMNNVIDSSHAEWHGAAAPALQLQAAEALESGRVLALPHLEFVLDDAETLLLSPEMAGTAKNVSLSADGATLRGIECGEVERQLLHGMMRRFQSQARALVHGLLPDYAAALQQGRTSFRPAHIEGRTTSWRKDDSRLHVDSFPSSPTAGRRIFRVFSNIHPGGEPRCWRLGEPFDRVAARFVPAIRPPLWGVSRLMHTLGVTKQLRTPYDHYMLALHDAMKSDLDYQSSATQQRHAFGARSSWLVYTDQASHAAMSGQHALEQTYLLPVEAMRDAARSPLRVLESLLGRALV